MSSCIRRRQLPVLLVLAIVLILILPAPIDQKCVLAGTTGKLTGKVTDIQTGNPIPSTNIVEKKSQLFGASSDLDGEFVILNIPPGTYDLEVSHISYHTITVTGVQIRADLSTELEIQLTPQTAMLKEVEVKGTPPAVMMGMRAEVSFRVDGVDLCDPFMPPPPFDQYALRPFHTEEYDRIYENQFLEVMHNPLSTFSIDVDAASYSNTRRFLNQGQFPPPDAVRIEEFINYFNYDYPQPTDEYPFSITTEISECPWALEHRLLHIGLQGKKIPFKDLKPNNIVFLLDVSGSMDTPLKLPLLKSAFRLLVDQLRPEDRVAIVVYAGRAGLILPSTNGDNKSAIIEAIDRLEAGGSTAGGEGILLAYKIAKENFLKDGNNRIILATDGDFNVGVSSDAELVRIMEEKRKEGIFISILGFGAGNYKDSKMEQIADKGNGNYAYVDNIQEARKVLVTELGATLVTIAKDVKIQIEFNPAKVKAYRLIGYENRLLKKEDFHDDTKDAGEIGAGHSVTALYELIPAGEKVEIDLPRVDTLKYQTTAITKDAQRSRELLTLKLRYKPPEEEVSKLIEHPLMDDDIPLKKTSDNFRFSAAVAAFGMLLRTSEFKGNSDFDMVLDLAKNAKGTDEEGYRAEFIRLVETAKLLKK